MELADRAAITDTVTRFGWCLDRRDWDGLAALFTDVVHTDYTALWGGEPQEASVDALLATDKQGSWRRTMDGLEATQHLITNILVDVTGNTATATANVVGVHRLTNPHGSPLWTVGGTYEFRFEHAVVVEHGAEAPTADEFAAARPRQAEHTPTWLIRAIKQDITWVEGNQQVLFRAAMRAA